MNGFNNPKPFSLKLFVIFLRMFLSFQFAVSKNSERRRFEYLIKILTKIVFGEVLEPSEYESGVIFFHLVISLHIGLKCSK